MNKKEVFLITGGSGFLGSFLLPLLSKENLHCQFIVVDRIKKRLSWHSNPNIRLIYGDMNDKGFWLRVPANITHIFHLAAVIPHSSSEKNKTSIFIDNISPLVRLIECARQWPDLKQVIFSSSISIYAKTGELLKESSLKKPDDMYGISKLCAEGLLQLLGPRGVRFTSLRYSSLYGYGQYPQTVLPIMIKAALRKRDILVYGEGKRTQDFLYCGDAARANLLAYKKNAEGPYNVGSGIPVTMSELAWLISKVFTKGKAKVSHIQPEGEQDLGFKIDISKAMDGLGYKPMFQIEDGLRRMKRALEGSKRK